MNSRRDFVDNCWKEYFRDIQALCSQWLYACIVCLLLIAQAPQKVSAAECGDDTASYRATDGGSGLESLAQFQSVFQTFIDANLKTVPMQWRQIQPSVYWCLKSHSKLFARMSRSEQEALIEEIAHYIVMLRQDSSQYVVLGKGRTIIALLDPEQGLDRKQITALASAYQCEAQVYKRTGDALLEEVAEEFVAALTDAVKKNQPTTVVVLGHGLPEEIQSYHISYQRVAAAVVAAARARSGVDSTKLDLENIVLIFDDCYSTDFVINLAHSMESVSKTSGSSIVSMPVMIAGANRNQLGHADVGTKFVTHFWDSAIELFFIRKPVPRTVTVRDFLERVDRYMLGFGRTPVIQNNRVIDYRDTDPVLFQDPVFFVPLNEMHRKELREILRKNLGNDPESVDEREMSAPLFLDIGLIRSNMNRARRLS